MATKDYVYQHKIEAVADYDTEKTSESPERSDDSILNQFSPDEQKKILHKVDKHLIPICGVMYCVSLLDRTNLSNASIAG